MDFEALSVEVMRHLRGRRTQPSFSRRLGFRSNVAWTWEAGRRWPRASTFLQAASMAGVDVGVQLRAFTRGSFDLVGEAATTPQAVGTLLQQLLGRVSIRECARQTGLNRFSLARWLRGETEPQLPAFMRVIDGTSRRLPDFVSLFVDPSELPAIATEWRATVTQREVAYQAPFSHVVLRALELEAYRKTARHEVSWLAARLGVPPELTDTMLRRLADANSIRYEDDHWVPNRILTVDTGKDAEAGLALRRHWARVGLERMTADGDDLFAYNLFTVSEKELAHLRKLYSEYFRTMRSVVASSTQAERVVLANVQLMTLDDDRVK